MIKFEWKRLPQGDYSSSGLSEGGEVVLLIIKQRKGTKHEYSCLITVLNKMDGGRRHCLSTGNPFKTVKAAKKHIEDEALELILKGIIRATKYNL